MEDAVNSLKTYLISVRCPPLISLDDMSWPTQIIMEQSTKLV